MTNNGAYKTSQPLIFKLLCKCCFNNNPDTGRSGLCLASFQNTDVWLKNFSAAGVIDDRGKFISITPEELESVAQFIRQRGRVSITELAQASNSLINLNPESRSAAWRNDTETVEERKLITPMLCEVLRTSDPRRYTSLSIPVLCFWKQEWNSVYSK